MAKHPPCTGCGKALFKTAVKGTAGRKGDPFVHCRTAECAKAASGAAKPTNGAIPRRARRSPARALATVAPVAVIRADSPRVKDIRKRIRYVMTMSLPPGLQRQEMALALAVTAQEADFADVGNVIIRKFGLDTHFGLHPR